MAADDPIAQLRATAKAIDEAVNEARIIASLPPDQAAFERATALAERLRALSDRVTSAGAGLRAQTAHRIWKAEQLSLAALAKRIKVSKTRADQLVKAGTPAPEEGDS